MKKTFFLFVSFFILLVLSSVAFSAEGPYISGNFGLGFLTDSDLSELGVKLKSLYIKA